MIASMARKKRPGESRRNRTYRFPDDLIARIEALAERNRRPTTTEIEIALEDHLRRNKLWPPPTPRGGAK
jgi:predicted transcriptional regulator